MMAIKRIIKFSKAMTKVIAFFFAANNSSIFIFAPLRLRVFASLRLCDYI
jgi:hypothetical protein